MYEFILQRIDLFGFTEWLDVIAETLTIIPSCMGILVTIAIISFVIRIIF